MRNVLGLICLLTLCCVGSVWASGDAQKSPVPTANAEAESLKVIKEIYGDDYSAAKTTSAKQALAKKLLLRANETENDPTSRYVLFRLARDIAILAADGQTAFQAIDGMDSHFQIDALEMKTATITKLAAIARTAEQHKSVVEKSLELMREAVPNNKFAVARQLSATALDEAKKLHDSGLIEQASKQNAEVEFAAKEFDSAKLAIATLEKSPQDSRANLSVGKFYCLVQGNWDKGLPLLALGRDEALKSLAIKELSKPSSSAEQLTVGDEWWKLSEKEDGVIQERLRERGAYWYRQALPGLTGMAKDKVSKRLQKVSVQAGSSQAGLNTPRTESLDVLELVIPSRHTAWGSWQRFGNRLSTREWSGTAIPVGIEGDYDLHIQFVRLSGNCEISVLFPVGTNRCQLFVGFAIGKSQPVSGFCTAESIDPRYNKTKVPGALINGKQYELAVAVRLTRATLADVSVTLNGLPYMKWQGDPAHLTHSPFWKWSDKSNVGLGARCPAVFSKAALSSAGGRIEVLR